MTNSLLLSTCHASPPCETCSVAHHNHSPHRDGDWRSPQAEADDVMLEKLCLCLSTLSAQHPHLMLSLENPTSQWQYSLPVQTLAANDGWQIVSEIDHCMVTCELDPEYFPMKPTTWVLFGCRPQDDLCCYNRCTNRLTTKGARHLHRVLICPRSDKHKDQIVLPDDKLLKSKIPLGMFRFLDGIRVQHDSVSSPTTSAATEPAPALPVPPSTVAESIPVLPPATLTSPPVHGTESFRDKIVATGKPANEPSINARVRMLNGLSYPFAIFKWLIPTFASSCGPFSSPRAPSFMAL